MSEVIMSPEDHDAQISHILEMLFEIYQGLDDPIKALHDLIGRKFVFYLSYQSAAISGIITGVEKYFDERKYEDSRKGGICLKLYISTPETLDQKIKCLIWHWEHESWTIWFEDDEFPKREEHGDVFRLVEA